MTFGSARPFRSFNFVVRTLLAVASLAALSSEGLSAREQRPPGRTPSSSDCRTGGS